LPLRDAGQGSVVQAFVKEVIEWLQPAYDAAGYALVAGAMVLESGLLLGVVVPGDVILAMAGVYVARGELSFPVVVAMAVLGTTAGEITGYWLGRRFGRPIIDRLPFSNRLRPKVDKAAEALRRNSGKAIVLGRFATGAGGTLPFAAGVAEIPFGRFLVFAIPTIAVWATALVLLGTIVGDHVETLDDIVSTFGWAVLAAIVLVIAGRIVWRRVREAR
jgi:membrane protein DedA with SNARE-associated domain